MYVVHVSNSWYVVGLYTCGLKFEWLLHVTIENDTCVPGFYMYTLYEFKVMTSLYVPYV